MFIEVTVIASDDHDFGKLSPNTKLLVSVDQIKAVKESKNGGASILLKNKCYLIVLEGLERFPQF